MSASSALRHSVVLSALSVFALASSTRLPAQTPPLHRGYYSDPALHGDTILFTSEGDL